MEFDDTPSVNVDAFANSYLDLLRPCCDPRACKRNGPILEEADKSESKQVKK